MYTITKLVPSKNLFEKNISKSTNYIIILFLPSLSIAIFSFVIIVFAVAAPLFHSNLHSLIG